MLDGPMVAVREVMKKKVVKISADDTLWIVKEIMDLASVRHIPVVDGGALVGVVSQRDLLRASLSNVMGISAEEQKIFLEGVRISEVMSAPARTIGPGAGNPQSVNRLVDLLGGEKIFIPKRPGEPACTWADISKITRDLGWKPRVSFEDGVAMMLKEIDVWQDAPLWEPASIAQATQTWFKYLGSTKA